jgi:hypothetical protein
MVGGAALALGLSLVAVGGGAAEGVSPRVVSAAPRISPVAPSTRLSAVPKAFSTTDGDILAITRIAGLRTPAIAIGGSFRHVITRDGVSHAARNFAILDERTGALLYAGNANSYVRAITSYAGITYLGGDFTTFAGATRRHTAALTNRFRLMAWRPSPKRTVRAMAADATGVYVTGDFGALWKIPRVTGRTLWTKPIRGGSGRALLVFQGSVYLGGLFDFYAGSRRHGLVRLSPRTGALITTFNARLRANSGVGSAGAFDGEEVLALAARGRSQVVLGVGGQAPAGRVSNEISVRSARTGSSYWRQVVVGDCQAVAVVGATDVAGYHRNAGNGALPLPFFAAQFNDRGGALTSWDPKLTGTQSNADGGNNGVQAMFADPVTRTLFVAGAFTSWNGRATGQSLVAFGWA